MNSYSVDDLLKSPFEKIKRMSEDGFEYWSARDLSKLLGYVQWRNFDNAVFKAKESCKNNGFNIDDHFADVSNMVEIGSGGEREVDDYRLSRFACYLIIQNADPSKKNVALGQTSLCHRIFKFTIFIDCVCINGYKIICKKVLSAKAKAKRLSPLPFSNLNDISALQFLKIFDTFRGFGF